VEVKDPEHPAITEALGSGIVSNTQSHQAVVRRTAALFADTLGPNGSDFSQRIERCQSLDELRELAPQMFAVVEGVKGSRILADFTRRLGVI
jgi:hypothetical protein